MRPLDRERTVELFCVQLQEANHVAVQVVEHQLNVLARTHALALGFEIDVRLVEGQHVQPGSHLIPRSATLVVLEAVPHVQQVIADPATHSGERTGILRLDLGIETFALLLPQCRLSANPCIDRNHEYITSSVKSCPTPWWNEWVG